MCDAIVSASLRYAERTTDPMVISAPDLIIRYFVAQTSGDVDTLLALFADDAVVVDEGRTRRQWHQ